MALRLLRALLVLALLLSASQGCRSPTQITLELTTDVSCAQLRSTSITVGRPDETESKPATAVTAQCQGGRIGALVVVPSGSRSEEVAIKVVSGIDRAPEDCAGANYAGCVVARRALRFLPHTELTLPIALDRVCEGVACDPSSTCVQKLCVQAVIANPALCEGAGCGEATLLPPGAGAGGASGSSGAGGASGSGATGGAGGTGGASGGPGGASGSGAGTGGASGGTGGASGTGASGGGAGGGGGTGGGGAGGGGTGGGTVAAPRPLSPLSTATVSSPTPTLRWQLGPGSDGAQVELFRDRACTQPLQSFAAAGTSVVVPQALSAGVVFWRLRGKSGGGVGMAVSPVWQFTVGHGSAAHDSSWGTTLDVNGDGFADLVVGASGVNKSTGAAYVYLGSAAGIASSPAVTLLGLASNDFFGASVASAGDINGDGFADLVVGASGVNSFQGAAYVYLGSASGLATAPSVTFSGLAQSDYFGYAAASAGDINGDGFADLVIGAFEAQNGKGAAYVYLGSASGLATTPSVTLAGPASSDRFAFSVASAGDINGDGFSDLVVGAYGVANNQGAAFVYLGSASGLGSSPSVTLTGLATNDDFGVSVASAGDVNGDGFADLIIGAFGAQSGKGAAYVYLGSAAELASSPLVTFTGIELGDNFGTSVASAGDINGDGFSDLVVGAYSVASNQGAAFVYLGSASGLSSSPAVTLMGVASDQIYGASVGSAGDINGDGFVDLVVGASGVNTNEGAAYVYLGGVGGLAASPSVTLAGLAPGDEFGGSVASAEEVSGDGMADVPGGPPSQPGAARLQASTKRTRCPGRSRPSRACDEACSTANTG